MDVGGARSGLAARRRRDFADEFPRYAGQGEAIGICHAEPSWWDCAEGDDDGRPLNAEAALPQTRPERVPSAFEWRPVVTVGASQEGLWVQTND